MELLDQVEENSQNFKNIKVETKSPSSIILTWVYEKSASNGTEEEIVFKLLKLETYHVWKSLLWTRKNFVIVENLEQNFCYTFRIHVMCQRDSQYEILDESNVFKYSILLVPSHTSFIRAIQKSHLELIKHYIELMPDFIELTFKSYSALSIAVSNNDIAVVRLLLEQGADVNFGIPEMSRTPLHIAIFNGFLNVADLLIKWKANIRSKDILGLNVAHHAIDSNDLDSVIYCIDCLGIHTETRDDRGLSLLLRAIVSKASLDIIRYLLDKKASQSVRDINNMSILQHVRMPNDHQLVEMLLNYKPKSQTDAKLKLKHNVQKLILSRKMKKEEGEDEAAEESVSAFEQCDLFK
ncbi:CLUMA_CG021056, isoform A [Clunio marinus]|uniref:CLUMA_CG021056, isoform A n=1 Tax=Clunio marinus TaxID=568069 RepID=A0A1J1J704_9DIPT|nr:CLUMA_CG021056, isoform A [Clunio marinus]